MEKYAFNIGNENTNCYLTTINSKLLFEMSKVSRANEDPKEGFQRHLGESRAKSIAKYIDNNNIIPSTIILSTTDNANLNFNENKITIEEKANSFIVIDGQHRLYGANFAVNEIELPVCIFDNLDLKEEVEYFLDINSNQKGVPKTLRIELSKFLSEPDSIDDIRNKLFKSFNNDVSSPLYDKLSAHKSVTGKISNVAFKESIDPIIQNVFIASLPFEKKEKLLINFITAVKESLIEIEGTSKRLTTAIFFPAIFKNFELIRSFTQSSSQNLKIEGFKSTILPIIERIDFDKYSGTSAKVRAELTSEIKENIELLLTEKQNSNPIEL